MATVQELTNLTISRLAVLGEQLHCFIIDGNTDCNEEYNKILCDIWRLYTIQQIINNEELLETVTELDPDIFEYWSNTIITIGGYSDDDFLVVNGQFLSFFQYYVTVINNGGSGGGTGNANFTPINVIGRNFEQPTLYNQTHIYNTLDEFMKAFLTPAQPPIINSWSGSMKLNDSSEFIPFGLVEKGSIVREIKATVVASRAGDSSGLLTNFSTTMQSPDPATPTDINPDAANATATWQTTINSISILTWASADKANKSMTVTVNDSQGKLKTSGSIGYTMANRVYKGVAAIPGTITSGFIQTPPMEYFVDTDQYLSNLALTLNVGQHGFYFHPDVWGNTIFTDNSINIAGGWTRIEGTTTLPNGEVVIMPSTILLTFDNGYTELYRGYITDNSNLGTISFKTTAS